ncbi:hypothetical protein AB0H71_13735 [Nocardia sp. NPDC050697]|uniref:hypothetical protein n=1 Tax=Nocardia sp. NPDC050697 TaxID=3155158 RepID=UPI00341073BF
MTAPMTYSEALVAAGALYAAAAAPRPTEALGETARAAAASTTAVSVAAVAAIVALWKRLDPYNDRAVARFAEESGARLILAQRAVATQTAAAQTQFLRLSGVPITVTPRVPDDVRLSRPDGTIEPRGISVVEYARRAGEDESATRRKVDPETARTDRVMTRAAEAYRFSRSRGATPEQAEASAENRIETIVDGNLQRVQAMVEHQAMLAADAIDLDRPIIGYRRIIHPELPGEVCGLCIVAADQRYRVGELKAIHGRCKCTVLPIFEDYDPGRQLNSDDLDRLYREAGGTGSVALKRTRYQIVEHDELGPQLVTVKKPAKRAKKTSAPADAPPRGATTQSRQGRVSSRQGSPDV